jgi:hypothetical protein
VTSETPVLSVEVDRRVDSPNRHGDDPWLRRRRRNAEAKATWDALRGRDQPPLPLRVRMVRCAPGVLDDDNLAGAFKAPRDAVADWLGTDDKPGSGVAWEYAQEKHREKAERRGRQGRVKVTHRVWFRVEFYRWDGCATTFVQLDGPLCGDGADERIRIIRQVPKIEAGEITDAHVRENGSVMRVARRSAVNRPRYVNVYWRFEWRPPLWNGRQQAPLSSRTMGIAFRERQELADAIPVLQAELEAWPIEREADNDAMGVDGVGAGGVRDGRSGG